MGTSADFLGLEHNTEHVVSHGHVSFWVRERIEQKMLHMVTLAERSNYFPSGTASKLYGTANFWETGSFGKIGRAGLNAIKDRQYDKDTGVHQSLRRSFEVLKVINAVQPRRIVSVNADIVERFCGASDAAYETGQGTGGYLLVIHPYTPREQRIGCVVQIPPQVYSLWGDQETYIAQLELMMVLAVIIENGHALINKRGVWFIDNVAALMALVRGRSNQPSLDHMTLLIHTALFVLRAWVYFEWVESDANWSDGISREGVFDKWHRDNSFEVQVVTMPHYILQLPIKPGLKVFEYLFGSA